MEGALWMSYYYHFILLVERIMKELKENEIHI